MEIVLQFCIVLAALKSGVAELSWHRWSFYKPPEPLEYNYRRSPNVAIEGPVFQHCQCPPHDECKVDFKLNEAVLDQLEIRGLITKEDVQELKDNNKEKPIKKIPRRRRGLNEEFTDDECCCPPRKVMMPTIITEKQFNESISRMRNYIAAL